MNPFVVPGRILVSPRPRDMRAGINTLAAEVEAALGADPCDGSLYVFLSRDCRRCKMLRFDAGSWCMWTLTPPQGAFRWRHGRGGGAAVEVGRAALVELLCGLDPSAAVRAR